ncbi:MAG: proliferating cell nuclear antigen (pcna) [Candidatus Hydrothermarchaeales archaeon]
MFKASLTDPKILKYSLEAISNMIDEAGVNVDEKGLRLRAMDPAHVALVDFELQKDAFDEFQVSEPLVLGLDLDRFNTILKRAGATDKISLELGEEGNSLKIKFENSSKRVFELPLIEVSEEELKVPSLDFPGLVELDPKIISEGIKDAEIISDHVMLRADEEFLYIEAKGDLGNVEVKVAKEEAITFEVKGECKSMFSIEYLKDMIKASDIANSVRISLGDNIPVKMDFLGPSSKLSFLLAPRIESE